MRREDFVCQRCGQCCRHIVLLTRADIERIGKSGCKDEEFLTTASIGRNKGKKCLIMVDNRCVFLEEQHQKTYCREYGLRPRICRVYPFFKKEVTDCKPKPMVQRPR